MTKSLLISNGIIFFYIIQRLSEVAMSRENEKWLKEHCSAKEVDPLESLRMKIFHSLWFVALILETNIRQEVHSNITSLVIYIILGSCLGVRFYSMEKLKRFWTIKIFTMQNQKIVTDGLYKYLRHPNYLVVILEFIFIPLLFKAYFTLVIFSLANLFILTKRIKLEESVLMSQSDYRQKFSGVKRLIPFFLIVLISTNNFVDASELSYQFKNYDEARESVNYLKFEGASTKLGLITTSFDGYAKDIQINYDLAHDQLNSLEVTILVKGLDTDIKSRDEKMHNEIFEFGVHPIIKARALGKLVLAPGEQNVDMLFTVKGKELTKKIKLKIEKKEDRFFISGQTSLSLKELALPDPSIAIATVRDNFDVKFAIIL